MKPNYAILVSLFMLIAGEAYALDLGQARSQGLVCEKGDGYVEATKVEAAGLATSVNAGRKAEYKRISEQKGQPVDVVAKLAAQEIVAQGHKLCK